MTESLFIHFHFYFVSGYVLLIGYSVPQLTRHAIPWSLVGYLWVIRLS